MGEPFDDSESKPPSDQSPSADPPAAESDKIQPAMANKEGEDQHEDSKSELSPAVTSPDQENRADAQSESEQHHEAPEKKRRWRSALWAHLSTQNLLVAANVLLVVVTLLQWSISKQNLIVSQRAYVLLKEVRVVRAHPEQPVADGDRSDLTVIFGNFGNTPATDAVGHMSWEVTQQPLTDNFDYPDHDSIASQSGPTSIGRDRELIFQTVVPTQQVLTTKPGGPFLYVWGWLDYRDVFGVHRVTKYCVVSDRRRPDFVTFNPCRAHNEVE